MEHIELKDKFKKILEEHNVTIEELHNNLKIPKNFLKNLIEGNYDQLPENVYTKGYLKEIIKFLKIDDELLNIYGQYYIKEQKSSLNIKYEPIIDVDKKNKNIFIFITLFLIILIIVGVIILLTNSKQVTPPSQPDKPLAPIIKKKKPLIVPENSTKSVVKENATITNSNNTNAPNDNTTLSTNNDNKSSFNKKVKTVTNKKILKDLKELTLLATDKVWVRVWMDNESRKTFILDNGSTRHVFAKKSFKIKIGNAGALKLFLDNKTFPFDGKKGMVKTLFINLDNLTQ